MPAIKTKILKRKPFKKKVFYFKKNKYYIWKKSDKK